ncbi:MAG: hypothetical protein NTY22_09265, partial [Proteobacteria bacterium]|nr:hypothetical protein [Pseudomonadota bacterium]
EDPHDINSLPIEWPVGIKNIGYLTVYDNYNNYKTAIGRYLSFQGNPVNWSVGLIALLLSLCLITARMVFDIRILNTKTFNYILIFTSLYIGYMISVTIIAIQRVLYINTYFLPLFFSFILFFLIFNYIFEEYIVKKDKIIYISLLLLVFQIFYVYYYASPITYAQSVTYLECEKTKIVDFWEDLCDR